jgi:hypothetical protein
VSGPGRHRSLARRVTYATLAAVSALALVEGALRLTLPVIRHATLPNEMIAAHLEGSTFRYDPDLYWYWADPLGGSGSAVNRYGFVRTRPMTQARPAGVTRVITFGDSQTFGAGVSPDHTYSAFAEQALGEGWEVLDAGISGYRSLNVYRLLQLRMEAFEPSVVVIDTMPMDSARDDGPLVGKPLGGSDADALRRWLWQSRIYYLLRLGRERLDPNRPRWLDQAAEQRAAGEGLGNQDRIAEWGAEHGVAVIFMEYAVMDDGERFGCMTRPGELPSGHFVVPTCEALAASGMPVKTLFQDRNHLTEAGNRLAGDTLATTLRTWRSGAVPPVVERPVPAGPEGPPVPPAPAPPVTPAPPVVAPPGPAGPQGPPVPPGG